MTADRDATTADVVARVDRVLLDLRALGAAIEGLDLGYPAEPATFEEGAAASRLEAVVALVAGPIPGDYAHCLRRCAGFVGMDFHNGYVMHTPEEVVRHLRQAGTPTRVTTADGAVPVLPVAADGGGNLFLLRLRAPHTVLRWDHELGGTHDTLPADHAALRPVSDDFGSLLERIRDDWRHFLGPAPASWTYLT